MKFRLHTLVVFAALLLVGVSAFAQGTTANLTGQVSQDGAGLPGVLVTLSSPALQGVRTTYTDVNGNYTFGALNPGEYTVKFDMEGMSSATRTVRVGLGQTG